MDDVRAVLDAASVRRAVLFGASEGVSLAILFAATYPERTLGLVAYGGFAWRRRTPDYPWAPSDAASARLMALVQRSWGGPMELATLTPSRANDGRFVTRFASYLRLSASPGRRLGAAPLQHRRRFPGRSRARGCADPGAAPHWRPRREDRRGPLHRPPHRGRAVRRAARRRPLAVRRRLGRAARGGAAVSSSGSPRCRGATVRRMPKPPRTSSGDCPPSPAPARRSSRCSPRAGRTAEIARDALSQRAHRAPARRQHPRPARRSHPCTGSGDAGALKNGPSGPFAAFTGQTFQATLTPASKGVRHDRCICNVSLRRQFR